MRCTPNWEKLSSDKKEALEMLATKISRVLTGNPDYHDNWHDIEGYTKLIADDLLKCEQKEEASIDESG